MNDERSIDEIRLLLSALPYMLDSEEQRAAWVTINHECFEILMRHAAPDKVRLAFDEALWAPILEIRDDAWVLTNRQLIDFKDPAFRIKCMEATYQYPPHKAALYILGYVKTSREGVRDLKTYRWHKRIDNAT